MSDCHASDRLETARCVQASFQTSVASMRKSGRLKDDAPVAFPCLTDASRTVPGLGGGHEQDRARKTNTLGMEPMSHPAGQRDASALRGRAIFNPRRGRFGSATWTL
ncbi:hypothetical protein Bbelb_031630 [Branchiostoma belcheri]|nr:hypothetical protein Bbelb_031630 [Branchiostoma belcheri]